MQANFLFELLQKSLAEKLEMSSYLREIKNRF